jgi:hypothetical protein
MAATLLTRLLRGIPNPSRLFRATILGAPSRQFFSRAHLLFRRKPESRRVRQRRFFGGAIYTALGRRVLMASDTEVMEALNAAGIQAVKAARNHSLFRTVNERIRLVADTSGTTTEFLCECASVVCKETIHLSVAEYERIRSSPTRFTIAVGHDLPEFENVIEVCDRYEVVQQKGAGRI